MGEPGRTSKSGQLYDPWTRAGKPVLFDGRTQAEDSDADTPRHLRRPMRNTRGSSARCWLKQKSSPPSLLRSYGGHPPGVG